MALEPEDAIPPEFLPAEPETAAAGELSDGAAFALFGLPWLAGAGWLEWNNHGTWWVSALLLSGFGFVGSGFLRGKAADFPIVLCALAALGLYVYGLVAADTLSIRCWLAIWLFDAIVLFGGAIQELEPEQMPPAPATGEIHDRRGRED